MRLFVPLFLAGYFGEWLEYLMGWFTKSHYLAPFIVLLLCGLGAPLPEEITLIGCGYLHSEELVGFMQITLVCSAAILIGDSIPYWLGRRYGLAALKTRWVAKVLHPERFAKIERRFEEHKNWSIFTCRFLPGLRIPGYFVAGTLRMSYVRFIVLDSIGVILSVPTSIWLASIVFEGLKGEEGFGEAGGAVSRFNRYLVIGLAVLIVGFFVWRKIKKKRKQAESPPPAPANEVSALVDARRYADALALIDDVDAQVGALVLASESDIRQIEAEPPPDANARIESRRNRLRGDLARIYEALLWTTRVPEAERIAHRAFEIDPSRATYTAFMTAALRAGAPAAARSIAGAADGDARLSEADRVEVRSVAP